MSKLKVTQKEGAEVPVEVLAQSIEQIAMGMKAIQSTRLKREAIVTLVHAHSKVPKKTVSIVLANLEQLDRLWLKPREGRA